MNKKSTTLKLTALIVAASVMSSANTALAEMEEVFVTATKREQTLQEVPVAVSVVDSATLERAQILDILDIQTVVPSLRVPQFQGSNQVNFVIRGFGNGANNVGIEPAVGVFIDGVYRSRSAAQISDLPNIQRVEVLRGPQSTLFGKNASAGVISIVTAKPEFEWNSNIAVTAANFGGFQTKGYVTGPLSETVAFSLGGSTNNRDGYTDNLALGTEINDRNRWSTNGQLLIEPSDTMSFRISADYSEIDEVCCSVANLVSGPTAGLIAAVGGALDNENPFSYNVFQNVDPRQEIENGGVSLHADFVFDAFTVTSITAYRNMDFNNAGDDVDYSSADLIAPQNLAQQSIKTFTQEFRISSESDGPLNWLAGAFIFNEDIETQGGISFAPGFRPYADLLAGGGVPGTLAAVEGALGVPAGTYYETGTGVQENVTQDNQAYSLFGTIDYDLTDDIVLTLGINYTSDEKQVSLIQINTDAFSQTALPAAFAGLGGLQFLPGLVAFPNAGENGESDDSNVDYTLRIASDLGDNMNVYASYATGFKATSWNLSRDSRPTISERDALIAAGVTLPNNLTTGTRQAGPEEAEVFEIGLKGQYEKVTFSLAIFDQTVNDFQFNAFTGAAFTLSNAGQTTVKGLEIESTFYPTENLVLTFAGTFLDPEYDSFPLSAFGDLSGQEVAGIAETSLSVSGTWNWQVKDYEGFVRADYQYESKTQILDDPTATAALSTVGNATREIGMLNASVGVTRGNYDLSLWGRNLNNDEFLVSAFPSVVQPGSFSGYPNQPRMFGLTLRARFN
jgi:iron complex outermembrane receptor protein